MRRLGWCILATIVWGCDGDITSSEDAAMASDNGTMEASVDEGLMDLDGALVDTGAVVDLGSATDVRLTTDVVEPPADPDASLSEICTPLGRCNETGGWCEAAGHPDCWRGEAPACFNALHPLSRANCPDENGASTDPICECPDSFEAAPGQDVCTRATSRRSEQRATMHTICQGPRAPTYGASGARFENTDGDETNDVIVNAYWGPTEPDDRVTGRLNEVGVWACDWQVPDQSGFEPIGEWIGISHCFSVEASGDYLVGMAADDRVRLKINGQLVFESPVDVGGAAHWYVKRLSLHSGLNVIEVFGRNTGNVGALGAEISGPFEFGSLESEAQQKAADYAGNIVYTTRDLVGTQFHIGEISGWSCPDDGQVVNTCRSPIRCTTIEQAPCAVPPVMCPAGQHPVDDVCVDNECVCAFGAPAAGEECPVDGAAMCVGCVQGYYLSEGECLENECGCDNGFPAESAACVENGAQRCLFCDDGYRLDDWQCLPFQCTCEGGVGIVGPLCPADGEPFCESCDAGLHVEDGVCVPNVCLCRNGEFDANVPCDDHRGDACSRCDEGYHLEGTQCMSNICVCDHGNRAFGPDCLVDGEVRCMQCMEGYRLEAGNCVAVQCSCINGTGAQGPDCPREGALRCAECDQGFRLDGNVCVQAECLCANGQPSIGDACPGIGVNDCASCNPGYELTDGACVAIACPCDNGQPAVGVACPPNDRQHCINCDLGYFLHNEQCVAIACFCSNGTGSLAAECPREGAAHCSACDDGYELDNARCVLLAEPTCDDGLQNADETDVDCAGHCPACEDGRTCGVGADCASGVCSAGICQAPACGDDVVNGAEGCDDGNANTETCAYGQGACQVCNAECAQVAGQTSLCGDNVVDGANGEACDDGNADNDDGCSNTCRSASCDDGRRNGAETGADCGGPCLACDAGEGCDQPADCISQVCLDGSCQAPRCGDSVINGTETCDDGNAVAEACSYGEDACQVCGAECVQVAGATSLCGDSNVDAANGEDCDDGNDDDDDGCDNACRSAACEDGRRNGGETGIDCGGPCGACDAGDECAVVGDCLSGVCNDGVCEAARCGDDVVNGRETCDDGNAITEQCPYGEDGCQVCGAECAQVAGGVTFCGDGIIDGPNGETCDDDNAVTEACEYGQQACEVCTEECSLGAGETSFCGDSNIDRDNRETCDDGNQVNEACPYGVQNCAICGDKCTQVAGRTSFCGDGVTDVANGEECDDANFDDADGCTAQCELVEACQGCGCGEDACEIGDRQTRIDTLNYNGMTFRPVDLDDCFPGDGDNQCCPGSTNQEQMDALCRLAGLCRAVNWTVEAIVADECYMLGECTFCGWFPAGACAGETARNYVTSVTCQ